MIPVTRREFIVTAAAGVAGAMSGAGAVTAATALQSPLCAVFVAGLALYVRKPDDSGLDVFMPPVPRNGVPHNARLIVLRESIDRTRTSVPVPEGTGDLVDFNLSGHDLEIIGPHHQATRVEFSEGRGRIDQCSSGPFGYRHIIDVRKIAPTVRADVAHARSKAVCSVAFKHGRVDVPWGHNTLWRWEHKGSRHAQVVAPAVLWTSTHSEARSLRLKQRGGSKTVDLVLVPRANEDVVVCGIIHVPQTPHADHGGRGGSARESHLPYLAELVSGVQPEMLSPTAYETCGQTLTRGAAPEIEQFKLDPKVSAHANVAGWIEKLCGAIPECVPSRITSE